MPITASRGGQPAVAEILDADVLARMQRPSDAAGNRIQLDADEAHSRRGHAHEIARAAARLQHGRRRRNAQAGKGVVHGGDDGGRGIEGVESGAFGAGIFIGREKGFELLAEFLPGSVLVAPCNRVGEYRKGDGPESAEAGERLLLLGRGRPAFLLNIL